MPEKAVTVAVVGDVTLERPLAPRQGDFPSRVIKAADVAVANLEAPCSERGTRADKVIALRSPSAAAAWVGAMGFHAVSLANNHAMDYGREALADTLSGTRNAGVVPFGAGANLTEALAPAVVTATSGAHVALLGLCAALPLGSAAAADRPGAAPMRALQAYAVDAATAEEQPGGAPYVRTWCVPEDVARAQEAIRRARRDVDAVVVVIHWGATGISRPRSGSAGGGSAAACPGARRGGRGRHCGTSSARGAGRRTDRREAGVLQPGQLYVPPVGLDAGDGAAVAAVQLELDARGGAAREPSGAAPLWIPGIRRDGGPPSLAGRLMGASVP